METVPGGGHSEKLPTKEEFEADCERLTQRITEVIVGAAVQRAIHELAQTDALPQSVRQLLYARGYFDRPQASTRTPSKPTERSGSKRARY
jgi:hypothetical protein